MSTTERSEQHEMIRLATASNAFQAHIWEQALQDEGIRCQVVGDYLDAGIGDIPGLSAEVWVDPADAERAEAILLEHQKKAEVESSDEGTEEIEEAVDE